MKQVSKQNDKFDKGKDIISYFNEEEQIELGLYLLLKNKHKTNFLLSNRLPQVTSSNTSSTKAFYLSKYEFEKKQKELLLMIQNMNYDSVSTFLTRKY